MTESYLSSAMNALNTAAHKMAPSMFETKMEPALSPSMRGKMIPSAPPQPNSEDLNRHYLSRDKTMENVAHTLSSYVNYASEVATDLKTSLPSAEQLKSTIPASIGLGPQLDSQGIPVPPPLPTAEDTHGHHLIPLAPPLPTREMMHKHYLIPVAPPLPSKESTHKHYLSRDKTFENASELLRSAARGLSDFASELKYNLPSAADLGLTTKLDSRGIPIPPPLPTREMMHRHYLIPMAPPLPSKEQLHGHYLIPRAPPQPAADWNNKHYMSRDKTVENAQKVARSYVDTAAEYVVDMKEAIVQAAPSLSTSSRIPAPPALPTRESTHKHYLSRPAVRTNKAYPVDMSSTERDIVDNLYKEEPVASSPLWSFNKVKRMANAANNMIWKFSKKEETGAVPVPPPMPTREMMHKHYLIPLAPPLPTKRDLNKHYMSRNKTIENAGSALSHALTYVTEVATDVKDYVLETPISEITSDLKETINPTPLDGSGIPIPPPLPTREMMHRHYLIPMAPPLPSKESTHKHYLSRDKTIENAGQTLRSAANVAGDMAVQVKEAIVDGAVAAREAVEESVAAIPEKAQEAGHYASEKMNTVSDSVSSAIGNVIDGAVQLKDKMMNKKESSPLGVRYSRSEVISESPILKKRATGARRISPRSDYNGFKPLLHAISQ